ncbi:MAG: hypothetical protein N2688_00195 [Burkholderiaceae bacterium]|nr:hypothetical protein [Burkholderiaceae bacterium]
MGAFRTDSSQTTNYLTTTGLTGLSTSRRVFIMAWGKNDISTESALMSLNNNTTDALPRAGLVLQNSAAPRAYANGSVYGTAPTGLATGQWHRWAAQVGPFDNTSRPRRFWVNGTNYDSADSTENNAGLTLSVLRIFVNNNLPNWSSWNGGVAELGIWDDPSDSDVTSLLTQQATLHVGVMTPAPTRSWRLLDDGNATTGGENLSMVGTVTFNASDHPPVGAPAAWRRRPLWWV